MKIFVTWGSSRGGVFFYAVLHNPLLLCDGGYCNKYIFKKIASPLLLNPFRVSVDDNSFLIFFQSPISDFYFTLTSKNCMKFLFWLKLTSLAIVHKNMNVPPTCILMTCCGLFLSAWKCIFYCYINSFCLFVCFFVNATSVTAVNIVFVLLRKLAHIGKNTLKKTPFSMLVPERSDTSRGAGRSYNVWWKIEIFYHSPH